MINKNYASVKSGQVVTVGRRSWTIEKILFSDYWDGYGYDIEFIDTLGRYHHWKQELDGGHISQDVKSTATLDRPAAR